MCRIRSGCWPEISATAWAGSRSRCIWPARAWRPRSRAYRSFADYRRALDGTGFPDALADLDDYDDHARRTIARTWELPLDALAADGRPPG
jgi:hypothetical protein